ncbi:MAG: radical SAM/SPASM domain-containing protein [bacterium]
MSKPRGIRVRHIFVELTNVCNFDCVFCPNEIMTRKRGFMPPELARKIIDEVAATGIAGRLTFHLMGEPMLHPNWHEIIGYAAGKGLETAFSTNASRADHETLDKLFGLPITHIVLSLQTPTPETFGLRRAGKLTFDDYTAGIRRAVRKKFEKGSEVLLDLDLLNTSPFVRDAIALRGDIRAVESDQAAKAVVREWVAFAAEVNREFGLNFTPPANAQIERLSLRKDFCFEILPRVHISTRKATTWANTFSSGKRIIPARIGGCSSLRDQCGILWNGELVLCCGDYDARTALGNVREKPIADILSGDYARRIRRNFALGILTHPYCRTCRGAPSVRTLLIKQLGTLVVHNLRLYRWSNA